MENVIKVDAFVRELDKIMSVLITEARSGHETMLDKEVSCMTVVCDEIMKNRGFEPSDLKIYDSLRMVWMAAIEYQKAAHRMIEERKRKNR